MSSEMAPEIPIVQYGAVAVAESPRFSFDLDDGIDINEAIQSSIIGVASDEELAWNEKVTSWGNIYEAASSEEFKAFVDFRALLQTMDNCCRQDAALELGVQQHQTLADALNGHRKDDGHGHTDEETKKPAKKKETAYSRSPVVMHVAKISLSELTNSLFKSRN